MAKLAGPKVKFVEPHRQVRGTFKYARGAES